ncbi:acyltransferase family protein [Loktanella agnita]|uniref:acyltransferase family protein n=1 Tax=Loktanella agnita TaxID=287097 RepID=UPI0039871A59
MTYIADRSKSRDNNFNLIRILAALAVLISHAHPITQGFGATEPFQQSLGHSLGTLAVYAFFILSGFLIANSFERSRSQADFIIARMLRILPGLIISVLFVMLVIGPIATTLPLHLYLAAPATWEFLPRNVLLMYPQYTLPGVFTDQPYPSVEGSIWTLFYGVICYFGLFLIGVIGLLRHRVAFTVATLLFLAAWITLSVLTVDLHPKLRNLMGLSAPFAIGMLAYTWQHRIGLSVWIALTLCALTWALRATVLYDLSLLVTMTYALFWLAYIPSGLIRAYNRLGDYSYGLYIYAFPMQGFAVFLFGAQTPLQNIMFALPLSLIPAILSWHYAEQPFLSARRMLVARWHTIV